MIRLSKRLAAIARCIPAGAAVIDVGTDHGHLPVWLIQTGRAERVCASDVNPAPLQRARALAEETDTLEHISLLVCDGLEGFTASDGDCVVIAGMGGETMIHILSRALWTKNNTLLVLQPQSKWAELRAWLISNHYQISGEELVEDAGRIYPILSVTGGEATEYETAELWLGKWEQISGDPLLSRFLLQQIARLFPAVSRSEEAAILMKQFEQWKERLES